MRGLWRIFRAFFSFWGGKASATADEMAANPHVMASTYDSSVRKKEEGYQTTKKSLARIVGLQEGKVQQVKALTSEIEHLEQVKTGALAKAKKVSDLLKSQGLSVEDIQKHADYLECKAGHTDASSTLVEKEARVKELEASIEQDKETITGYKLKLQTTQREIEKLRQEKHEAISDIQIAKDHEESLEMESGMAKDTTDEDLLAARQARTDAKARARIVSEIRGSDSKVVENEFIKFAKEAASNSEFDSLMGLDAVTTSEEKSPLKAAQLPEA